MFLKFIVVMLFGLGVEALLVNDPRYCYTIDPLRPQIAMFGTTTPYDRMRDYSEINSNVSKCKPSRIWYLGRHGSRYPSSPDNDNLLSAADTINIEIYNNYQSGLTKLCPLDAENIKRWKINANFTLSTPGALTETGWTELSKLASRIQAAYPNLLPKKYNRNHYYFRHSPIPRTLESAQAFARGLFGSDGYQTVDYQGQSPDPYLVPFYACATWISSLNAPEPQIFTQSTFYQDMIKEVSEKLGFYGDQQLPSSMVDKLITHCKYEQIYNHILPSPFCSAFSYANHQVNEYYRDLQFYYMAAYGNTANRKLYENMSCYLLQAILKFLQSNNPSDQKAQIWLGHDVTLQFMFTALGLFEDKELLTASNFEMQTSRLWKSSILTPMGGNLVIVRYDCPGGDNDILFLHNERPLQIPGCSSNGLCKQSVIMQKYSRFLNANCDAIFCTNN